MLRNELFQLVKMDASAGGGKALVKLLPESAIYAAHFKGMPVTPGACLIQIACELVSEVRGEKLDVAEASDIRFVNPVLPDQISELEYEFSRPLPVEDPDLWSVHVLAGETLCARMKLTLKP